MQVAASACDCTNDFDCSVCQVVIYVDCLQPHRPRGAEGGGRHKKRVRQPHNTRERQRQIAVGHGEYIMPDANPYRSPKVRLRQENNNIHTTTNINITFEKLMFNLCHVFVLLC